MILPHRYANNTNATFSFHGPRGADEDPGPVKWIRPYFDCGRSNEWKFAAAVPVVDIYPRHTRFRHIEYPSYTGVAVLEMNFERIDINQVRKHIHMISLFLTIIRRFCFVNSVSEGSGQRRPQPVRGDGQVQG